MISFKNVSYHISKNNILKNISFNIKKGEKVLICGSSGSGKSSLVNLLLLNIFPTSGHIYYDKEDINSYSHLKALKYKKERVILILQNDDLFDYLSVKDNLTLFYYEADVIKMLRSANILHLQDRIVSSLSGGERQRVAIIKACLSNSETLVCDEITSALDEDNAIKILDFVLSINQNKTIIFISHDLDVFDNKIDHLIKIENHIVKEDILINDKKETNEKSQKKDNKNLYQISLNNGIKRWNFSSLLVCISSIICFIASFCFNDIFDIAAKKSYSKYLDYDVLEIKDNKNIIANYKEDIYYSFVDELSRCEIRINKTLIDNITFYPFNNKNDSSILVINSLFKQNYYLDDAVSIEIKGLLINEKIEKIDFFEEDNMFSSPCIYYDIKYFNIKYEIESENLYIIKENYNDDDRFTNNPLFEDKKEDKPYLEGRAYDDYLIFKTVFSSLKTIVYYYFFMIICYSIIVNVLINISIIIKDTKQIAIYISRGYKDFEILIAYLLTPLINHIAFLFLIVINVKLFLAALLSLLINIISVLLSFYYIKSQTLHTLLKEDNLC